MVGVASQRRRRQQRRRGTRSRVRNAAGGAAGGLDWRREARPSPKRLVDLRGLLLGVSHILMALCAPPAARSSTDGGRGAALRSGAIFRVAAYSRAATSDVHQATSAVEDQRPSSLRCCPAVPVLLRRRLPRAPKRRLTRSAAGLRRAVSGSMHRRIERSPVRQARYRRLVTTGPEKLGGTRSGRNDAAVRRAAEEQVIRRRRKSRRRRLLETIGASGRSAGRGASGASDHSRTTSPSTAQKCVAAGSAAGTSAPPAPFMLLAAGAAEQRLSMRRQQRWCWPGSVAESGAH